jgi:hypothetical protein
MEPRAARSRASLSEGLGRRQTEQRARHAVPLRSSSLSERSALTGTGRRVTDVVDERYSSAGERLKPRRRNSARKTPLADLDGRMGEETTATSSASAHAIQIELLNIRRLPIMLSGLVPAYRLEFYRREEGHCQVLGLFLSKARGAGAWIPHKFSSYLFATAGLLTSIRQHQSEPFAEDPPSDP